MANLENRTAPVKEDIIGYYIIVFRYKLVKKIKNLLTIKDYQLLDLVKQATRITQSHGGHDKPIHQLLRLAQPAKVLLPKVFPRSNPQRSVVSCQSNQSRTIVWK